MSPNLNEWAYTGMSSEFSTSIDGTNGVFRFKTKSDWEIHPNLTMGQRLGQPIRSWRTYLVSPQIKFAETGSIHGYAYAIQSSGVASCHVQMFAYASKLVSMEFDLPSTPADDFTQALERVGDAKVEHPIFGIDKTAFQEDVTLDGVTTRVTFEAKPTTQ